VGKAESVRFNQPNASAITLNRVTGTERSEILGSLSANGQVFILNPNGVLFGKGAQVNVGGLVASTLRMSNDDFMAGNFRLTEGPNARASVSNEGEIRVAEGGVLALIAPVVTNTGTLAAPQGSVLMAAADAVSVTLQDGSLVSYTSTRATCRPWWTTVASSRRKAGTWC
jgi:filamentous hemagglutinin family protein